MNWWKRNWQYWIKPENRKYILMHLAGNLVSIPITVLLILFTNNPEWVIRWMCFFSGVTAGWELLQAWNKWKYWGNSVVLDTIMDILSPNLISWLIIYLK